jgi:hypothetical protein
MMIGCDGLHEFLIDGSNKSHKIAIAQIHNAAINHVYNFLMTLNDK